MFGRHSPAGKTCPSLLAGSLQLIHACGSDRVLVQGLRSHVSGALCMGASIHVYVETSTWMMATGLVNTPLLCVCVCMGFCLCECAHA